MEKKGLWRYLNVNEGQAKAIKAAKESLDGWTPVDHLVQAAKLVAKHAKHADNCPFDLETQFGCTCGLDNALCVIDEWSIDGSE